MRCAIFSSRQYGIFHEFSKLFSGELSKGILGLARFLELPIMMQGKNASLSASVQN